MNELYIGLISGTSIDGIDASLVDFSTATPKLIATHNENIPDALVKRIIEICTPGNNEIDKLGQLDIELGELFAKAAMNLLKKSNTPASSIKAIGSHGQTVRHRPTTSITTNGFTLQIADPNTIAERTGITTAADFRRRDLAAGGQGAPFAPVFHQAISPNNIETTAFLNLGGIANITLIHQESLICGFDTGPANGLMDAWIQKHKNKPYDDNGNWAATGTSDTALLQALRSHPYFTQTTPKSTGREEFNIAWLEKELVRHYQNHPTIDPADIQATLMALSSTTIANAIQALPHKPNIIYCCGGGVYNNALINAIKRHLSPIAIQNTNELGIAPDWIEACAFAWLAKQTLHKTPTNLGPVTGAQGARVVGGLYWA